MRTTALLLVCLVGLTARATTQADSAASWLARGDQERQAGKYAEALSSYERAREAAEQTNDLSRIAAAWHGLGTSYTFQSEYRRALECLEKAVAMREQLGETAALAASLSGVGIIHRQQGRVGDAIVFYTRALSLLGPDDRLMTARILNNIGVAQVAQGEYDAALRYYAESLPINEALNNVAGVSSTLINIGIVHRQRGDNAAALQSYERGLVLARGIGDRATTAEALKAIGVVHSSQGNEPVAMDFYAKARALYTELGDQRQIALIQYNVGVLQQRANEPALARASHLEALRIREAIGDQVGIAESRLALGGLSRGLGDLDTAEHESNRALAIYEAIGDRRGTCLALNGLQLIAIQQGRHAVAVSLGQRAADLAQRMGDRERLWQTLTLTGRAQSALGNTAQARESLTAAIRTIEALRDDVAGGEADRQRAFERKVAPYHRLLSLSIAEGANTDALRMAERAKARVVLDILQSGRVNITSAMTEAERTEERAILNDLAALNARVVLERRRTQGDPALLADLEQQLSRARFAREALETRLFAAHPELRRQRSETPPAGIDEIASALPDTATAALQYVVTEDDAWLFVITKSIRDGHATPRLDVHRLSIKPAELTQLTERLTTQLAQRDLGFRPTAAQAYDILLRPAAVQLAGVSTLVIVPDAILWRVPFQALWNRRLGQYVVESQAVTYSPSLSVLVEMRRANRQDRTAANTANTLLAFGDPSQSESARAGAGLRLSPLAPLPSAAAEVRALGRLYGASTSRVYVGRDAREDRMKSEASRFSILHLATHGVLDDASPMYSQVLLAPSPGAAGDDGQLQAWELARLQLNARLVVLSGCETARGRVAPGEGVIGLTWSLFVAGASTAVVSQWSVDSASTSDLMLAFHRHMLARTKSGRTMSAARALQQAAIPSLRSSQYRHPFYWAAFVVVGDGL